MCRRLSDWICKVSTGRVTVAALVVFLLFTALVLPRQSAQADMGAEGVGSPDLSLYYTPDQLYRIAEAYGSEGRSAYIRARFTFDLAWPVVYTLFLGTAISWLVGRAFPAGSWWQRANLVPILGTLFDYLENLSTSAVMWRYPARTPVVDTLAPVFTLVKWIFVGGSFVLLFVGLTVVAWRWMHSHVK